MAEPFITLFESASDSSASTSFDDSTPLSTPPSTTHDNSRASFHVKDLENFAKDLQNAADRAFPNQGRAQTRYKGVSVLLLRWENDEMDVEWELEDLQKVFMKYGFNTEKWLIPTKNSHLKLMSKAIEVVEQHSDHEHLVIIYYAGHALINNARQATWTCKSDARYASLEWSAIQTLFEKANFDVLLLLDCCAAASAAPTVGSAVTETIAACGFENSAPQPGRHSFTNTLIEVLEDWIDCPPFSAAMLHNKVLSILKHERPERPRNGKRRRIECRRTPIHIMGTADPRLPSIELGRRAPPLSYFTDPIPPPDLTQEPGAQTATSSKQNGYHANDLNDTNGEDFRVPRVLISLALEEDQSLNSKTCEKWLSSCPVLVKFAKVEAVYKSFSTLLILSIPVFIWNLLPEEPACSFVGYVTSTNMVCSASKASRAELLQQAQVEAAMDGFESPTEGKGKLLAACDVCKADRKRCDGEQPSCGLCERSGWACTYGITEKKMTMKDGYLRPLEQIQRLPAEAPTAKAEREPTPQIVTPNISSFANHKSETTVKIDTPVSNLPPANDPFHSTFPTSDNWDKIVDTCFPSESGTKPQDWVFNFDCPVPPSDSQERHLNVHPPRHMSTVDKAGGNTFYGTISRHNFAPWDMDAVLDVRSPFPQGYDEKVLALKAEVMELKDSLAEKNQKKNPLSKIDSNTQLSVTLSMSSLPEPRINDTDNKKHMYSDSPPTSDTSTKEPRLPTKDKVSTEATSEKAEDEVTRKNKDQIAVMQTPNESHSQDLKIPAGSHPFSERLRKWSEGKDLAKISYSKEDWNDIAGMDERRRIQNRVAQRTYRTKLKERLEALNRSGEADAADRADVKIDDDSAGLCWGGLNSQQQRGRRSSFFDVGGLQDDPSDARPAFQSEVGISNTSTAVDVPRDGGMDPIEE